MESNRVLYNETGTTIEVERIFIGEKQIKFMIEELLKERWGQSAVRHF